MYTLVRRFIKTAVGVLLVGLAIGGYMVVERELLGRAPSPYYASAHTHAILVGFVMMMILGVALWLFARPDKADARYRPRVAEAACWMLARVAAVALFFYTMWSRIRPAGSQSREARGERF